MREQIIIRPGIVQSVVLILCLVAGVSEAQIYSCQKGAINLLGEAPNETITAKSEGLAGKLDVATRKFNFRADMNTFSFSQGDLQTQHAKQSYFESQKYPYATFAGEITNDIDLKSNGIYQVTVRGKFSLHGVDREMKIPATIDVSNGTVVIATEFKVFLSDHNIKIPRLVSAKVAPEFLVKINTKMAKH